MTGGERVQRSALAAGLCLLGVLPVAAQDVNVPIGNLPAGKTVKVVYNADVSSPLSGPLVETVQNQGLVTGANFSAAPTDDPDDPTSDVDPTLTSIDSLTIGDRVWRDDVADGVFGAGDTGVDGVTVNLYLDDGDGLLDAGDGAPIATEVTAGGGLYLFDNLQPGDYVVEVALCNFTGVGCPAVLAGLGSIGPVPAADPDDDADNDDNGDPVAGFGTAAQALTLVFNDEPPALPAGLPDGDADTDTNLTVDFGFSVQADVEITSKTDSADPVTAGENLTYTIDFVNNGPGAAPSTMITDPTPAGTTFVSAIVSSGAGWMVSAPAVGGTGNVVFSKPSVASAETATFTVTVQVDSSVANGSSLTNTATATSGASDPVPSNNSKMESTAVVASADVELTAKSDAPDPVNAGENLTYTIEFQNNGPSDAQTVTVSDTLPAGTTFVSAAVTAGSGWMSTTPAVGSGGTVEFAKSPVAAGETATFEIVVDVDPDVADGATIANTATASTATSDPTPGNNTAMASTTVATEADLALTKADDVDPQTPGSNVVYTLEVDNLGPSDAQGVEVTDTLPAGMTFVVTSGCDNDPSGYPVCELGTIAAGASKSYTLTATVVKPAAAGVTSLTNMATVSSDTTDPVAGNNAADEDTAITAAPDLTLTKSDGDTTSFPGGTIAYDVTYENVGDQDANGVVITETVPADTTFNEAASGGAGVWSCADGAPAATVCTHTVGSLSGARPSSRFVVGSNGGPRPITLDEGSDGGFGSGSGSGGGPRRSATVPSSGSGSSASSAPRERGPGGPSGNAASAVTVVFAVDVDPAVMLGPTREIVNEASIADDGGNGADPTPGDNTASDTTPLPVDFGDAPDPLDATAGLYPTLVANDGPRHAIRPTGDPLRVFLGADVDDDSDGQPSPPLTPAADGDDTDGNDDEDGVTFAGGLVVGADTDFTVTASAAGLLNAWIDFDVDGVFSAGEQVFADEPLAAGANVLIVSTPAGALTGPTADLLEGTFARFRFDTTGGLGPTGQSDHGEVEDYFVPLLKEADLGVTIAPRTAYGLGGSLLLYDVDVENLGPALAEDAALDLDLPANTVFVGVEPAATACTQTGSMLACDLGDLAPATTTSLVVGLWVDPRFELDLLLDAAASSISLDPVPGNDTAADTTPATRGRALLATEVTDPIARDVFVAEVKEAEETAGLIMKDGPTGDTLWVALYGTSTRAVDFAAVPDFGDTPSPEIAVLGFGFDGSTDVTVVDGTSTTALSSFEIPGSRIPIAIEAIDDLGGPPAPDLAILSRASDGSSLNLIVVDAGDGTLIADHILSMPVPPAVAPFPVALAPIDDLLGAPTPDLAILTRNPDTGATEIFIVDPTTGPPATVLPLGPGIFPTDLEQLVDLGGSAAPELAVLGRRESDSKTVILEIDPMTGGLIGTVELDPMLTPVDLAVLPDFDGGPAPEVAALGSIGPKIVNEVRDAGTGGPLGGTIVDPAPSPVPLVPLSLDAFPMLPGGPSPALGFLGEFLGDDPALYLTDGNGVPVYALPLLP